MTGRLTVYLRILWLVLIALAHVPFFPAAGEAQQKESSVSYFDAIPFDEEEGRLFYPSFVFFEPARQEIYVLDARNRLVIYSKDLFPVFTVQKGDGMEAPQALAVDRDGTVFVAVGGSQSNPRPRLSVFNACLRWERDLYLTGFPNAETFAPFRLVIDKEGNLVVSGHFFPIVPVLDRNGALLDVIAPDEDGAPVNINDVAIDSDGRIYLASADSGRIYVYDSQRRFLFKFGEKGGGFGKLSRPASVGIDSTRGWIYVVDYMRHTVNVYDREGKFLFEFGGKGWSEGWFQHPQNLSVDPQGTVYIADTFNDRVQVFKPKS